MKCIFPFKNPKTLFKKLVLEMQNVMHTATNAGHTAQNDGREEPPQAPGDPPYPYTWKNFSV